MHLKANQGSSYNLGKIAEVWESFMILGSGVALI